MPKLGTRSKFLSGASSVLPILCVSIIGTRTVLQVECILENNLDRCVELPKQQRGDALLVMLNEVEGAINDLTEEMGKLANPGPLLKQSYDQVLEKAEIRREALSVAYARE